MNTLASAALTSPFGAHAAVGWETSARRQLACPGKACSCDYLCMFMLESLHALAHHYLQSDNLAQANA